jgi:hypothetical protein
LINFSISLLSEENRISYGLMLSLNLGVGVCEEGSPTVRISFLKNVHGYEEQALAGKWGWGEGVVLGAAAAATLVRHWFL